MTLVEIIAIIALSLVLIGAVCYIVLSKKRGKRCIGCPYADSCTSCKCGGKNNK